MTSEPDAITLTWTPRSSELAQASIARGADLGAIKARAVLGILLALVAAAMFTSRWTVVLGMAVALVALTLVSVQVTAPVARRRWDAVLAANPVAAETCTVTLDTEGVHQTSDRFSASRRWSTLPSWNDTPDAVVLATSGAANAHLVVVPHRAAGGQEEVARLRRLVEHHLGPPHATDPRSSARLLWVARFVIAACLAVPLALILTHVHDEGGEWRLIPSEAPPRLTRDGAVYLRDGGPTVKPANVTGSDYTPGGGLVMVSWPPTDRPASELWVLDHEGVTRHYVRVG